MKIPKLKYYYLALNATDYELFESTRQVRPNPLLYLYARPTVADTRYRQLKRQYSGSVYVLRIPAALIPRRRLVPAPDAQGMWILDTAIAIEHCAVERFDQDTSVEVADQMVSVGSIATPLNISIPVI
jgi:hypothetical protein